MSKIGQSRLWAAFAFTVILSIGMAASAQATAPEEPAFISTQGSARQGDPVFAEFGATVELSDLKCEIRDAQGKLLARGKVFGLPPKDGPRRYGAMAGLGWEANPGTGEFRVLGKIGGQAFSISAPLSVLARLFPTDDVKLDHANTEIRTAPDPKKTEEAVAIQSIYAKTDPNGIWASGAFVPPVGDARRSAGFGDRRRYLYATGGFDSTWHTGIDFAVPVGTAVCAPAAGRVIFSGARIVTGYTMVIEHLPGLYSVLMHLSRGLVPEGTLVKQGEPVALSGATGLATGPHLHWEVRAGEVPVDPDFFVNGGRDQTESAKAGSPAQAAFQPFPWLDTTVLAGQ